MQTIGRYQPRKKIGSGSQGAVYLCLDPKLKRQVAIKVLNKPLLGGKAGEQAFEQEAQALGKFQHQNIVSVYDVGTYKSRPYIVFEYVEGKLLSDVIKKGDLSLPRIVELFSHIVSGVSQAHQAGVIHRDLKPQNIMINASGVPKIMDFGIAMLVDKDKVTSDVLIGTPRYMAPEYIRQRQVSPAIDVFALGAIFYEMLTRHPAFAGKSTSDVLSRILMGPPKRPSSLNEMADDVIDGICMKALAANDKDRYQDAGRMQKTLDAYIKDNTEVITLDDHGKSTLDFLYRRMQRKKDFPGLAESIRAINALQSNSEQDAEKLAAVIVKDFALTNKILKVVNSAYYGTFSGKIGTISRAIVILGVETVRSIAATLIFFEHMSNRAVASKLKKQMASSIFRAIFARELTQSAGIKGGEESFLCAMFHQLGMTLVTYYLPEEDGEIERLIAQGELSELEAVNQILGVSFEEVGVFVARQWNFPDIINHSMQKPVSGKVEKPRSKEETLKTVTHMSECATGLLAKGGTAEEIMTALEKYDEAIPVTANMVDTIIERSREEFSSFAEKLSSRGKKEDFVLNLQGKSVPVTAPSAVSETGVIDLDDAISQDEQGADNSMRDIDGILSNGLQEATNLLLETGNVAQVFNTVLETLYRGMRFRRVFLCLLKNGVYTARLGFGEEIDDALGSFKVSLDNQKNVFSVSIKEGLDVYIADVNDEKMRKDLPSWYFKSTDAGSFVLFPMKLKNRAIGFIYGEFARANEMEMEAKTFNLIKSLRNQMVLAVRQ